MDCSRQSFIDSLRFIYSSTADALSIRWPASRIVQCWHCLTIKDAKSFEWITNSLCWLKCQIMRISLATSSMNGESTANESNLYSRRSLFMIVFWEASKRFFRSVKHRLGQYLRLSRCDAANKRHFLGASLNECFFSCFITSNTVDVLIIQGCL